MTTNKKRVIFSIQKSPGIHFLPTVAEAAAAPAPPLKEWECPLGIFIVKLSLAYSIITHYNIHSVKGYPCFCSQMATKHEKVQVLLVDNIYYPLIEVNQ